MVGNAFKENDNNNFQIKKNSTITMNNTDKKTSRINTIDCYTLNTCWSFVAEPPRDHFNFL